MVKKGSKTNAVFLVGKISPNMSIMQHHTCNTFFLYLNENVRKMLNNRKFSLFSFSIAYKIK